MNTKLLMSVSAVTMGIAGIALLFFPKEITNYIGLPESTSIILQILGSLYFGFAILNWTAKANIIGGIYSKPVAIGNFTHFAIGALSLVKVAFNNITLIYIWITAIVYIIFAVSFGYVFFKNPVMKNNKQ